MANSRKRIIPRRQAFFGLHFDLHPNKDDTSLGAQVEPEMIARLLQRVRPDYVQYDCKGHPGYTGYPTRIGWASPGIVRDSLAIWRQATRAHGVGLYIHYSGVWDSVAIEHHPEWARLDAEGRPDVNATSTFGPYVDELMIPQLKEVVAACELDGLWVDGECWATKLDYAPAALAAWKESTGEDSAPKDRSDPRWLEWKMFHRRQFERYLDHWVDALHAFRPKLQITSNWMYSTFAPKPAAARLDYLSGDYSPSLSADRARVEARYLASTEMPWDLMAWGFNWGEGQGHNLKTPLQLQQEAAVVLMQGGGFQIYYQPTRSGQIIDQIIATTGEVADFCRARQSTCHKSASVPQVALLLSSETLWDRSDNVFSPWKCFDELEGALHALLDLHYSVDILAEHRLQPRLAEFPLVVIPEAYRLSDEFRAALLEYARAGGSLLLIGARCARLFAPHLGAHLDCPPETMTAEVATAAGVVSLNGEWQRVSVTRATPAAWRYPTRDTRAGGDPAATVISCGKGQIGAIYGPAALAYFRTHHPALRALIGDLAARLFPDPLVTVEAPPCVDIALRRTRAGKLSLHLLNLTNTQRAERFLSTDYIPTAGPIEITLRVAERPKRVRWSPSGRGLAWKWASGLLTVTLKQLAIHGVVVID